MNGRHETYDAVGPLLTACRTPQDHADATFGQACTFPNAVAMDNEVDLPSADNEDRQRRVGGGSEGLPPDLVEGIRRRLGAGPEWPEETTRSTTTR